MRSRTTAPPRPITAPARKSGTVVSSTSCQARGRARGNQQSEFPLAECKPGPRMASPHIVGWATWRRRSAAGCGCRGCARVGSGVRVGRRRVAAIVAPLPWCRVRLARRGRIGVVPVPRRWGPAVAAGAIWRVVIGPRGRRSSSARFIVTRPLRGRGAAVVAVVVRGWAALAAVARGLVLRKPGHQAQGRPRVLRSSWAMAPGREAAPGAPQGPGSRGSRQHAGGARLQVPKS
jgi:hypothetical protein